MNPLENIRIVLVGTLYTGNVGSSCRAMANMGIRHLRLAAPNLQNDWSEGERLAVHATDVLGNREEFASFEESVSDCVAVVGTTAREGLYRQHVKAPRDCAADILALAAKGPVALVFGREDKGLLNEEIAQCTHLIRIPVDEGYTSINLSQAVLITCYEFFTASGRYVPPHEKAPPAPQAQKMQLMKNWASMLLEIGFMKAEQTDHFMQGFHRVFSRGVFTKDDAALMLGVARQAIWAKRHGAAEEARALAGRRVLVTGASSGIGRACAILAARLGATVVLTARRADALEETRAMMDRAAEHVVLAGDIADEAFVEALPQRLLESVGPLDGFVHAAGNGPAMPVGVTAPNLLADSMRVNYFAFMLLMKAFSRSQFAAPGFSAVAVSSVSASAGWAGGSLYAGSKGALSAAVRSLAVELAPKGYRVNAVCPGFVRTPLFDAVAGPGLSGPDGEVRLRARQPLGLGEPEQVAAAVCFLLSGAADFITGVNLPVDGGLLAQ